MALVTKNNTFSAGATILAVEHNENFDTLYNDYNGNITNANIAAGAAIADTKLAQITTAAKVTTSALSDDDNVLVPSGAILMWSGAVSAIPSGWVICDGNNGTPNLTDRFVIHADADSGGTNNVGDTGGSHTMAHTHNVATADYDFGRDQNNPNPGFMNTGPEVDLSDGKATNDITTDAASNTENRPKYYALAFIMKT